MTEALNREDVIELLKRLGSESDEEVLTAARDLHERITVSGTDWEDLLVPTEAEDDEPDAQEAPEAPAETTENDAETLALIDKLLARPGISNDFREELTGYKDDIAEGEFEDSDHRYVRALYKRLSPSR